MPSPKLIPLELTDDERRTLNAWARRRKTAQALALRSRIVLACAEGGTIRAVAAELGVSRDWCRSGGGGSCGTGWKG